MEVQNSVAVAVYRHLRRSDPEPAALQLNWQIPSGVLFAGEVSRQPQTRHRFAVKDAEEGCPAELGVGIRLIAHVGEQCYVSSYLWDGEGGSGHDHVPSTRSRQPALKSRECGPNRKSARRPVARCACMRSECEGADESLGSPYRVT